MDMLLSGTLYEMLVKRGMMDMRLKLRSIWTFSYNWSHIAIHRPFRKTFIFP